MRNGQTLPKDGRQKKIRLYLAVIAVKCDKGLEIVDVNALGQLIAIGFQVGPVRQSGGSVAWTKK